MKNYKYIGLFLLSLGIISCDVDNQLEAIPAEEVAEVPLNKADLDFSSFVSVGASFTAGYTDGAMFKAAQENSFPNILAKKFGTNFSQPLMDDNIGGLILGGTVIAGPRLYFNGAAPALLAATPTTDASSILTGSFNNMGVPGAKSFHLLASGYGNIGGLLTTPRTANPYYVRMASSPAATVVADAVAQNPTFFTLSEIGGNDVLGYATSGGDGSDPITPTSTFDVAFNAIVNSLTANGAKGVVGNIPYITSLAHFTTVPYNALDPTTDELAPLIPTLNSVYGALNQIFTTLGETDRVVVFSATEANPIVIKDEKLTNLSAQITGALNASSTFPAFVQSFGLPAQAAPLVANLLGITYGQSRPATSSDLFVLTSSSIIGKENSENATFLMQQGLSETLAKQFSAEGVTLPLADKWVLTPEEQNEIKIATDAYNLTIKNVAEAKGLALVDFKTLLINASDNGYDFDDYTLTTKLVTGGLISLDGIHLTPRGYAMMANEFLKAIDEKYETNFKEATNGLAKAGDYPTNFSPLLK